MLFTFLTADYARVDDVTVTILIIFFCPAGEKKMFHGSQPPGGGRGAICLSETASFCPVLMTNEALEKRIPEGSVQVVSGGWLPLGCCLFLHL